MVGVIALCICIQSLIYTISRTTPSGWIFKSLLELCGLSLLEKVLIETGEKDYEHATEKSKINDGGHPSIDGLFDPHDDLYLVLYKRVFWRITGASAPAYLFSGDCNNLASSPGER